VIAAFVSPLPVKLGLSLTRPALLLGQRAAEFDPLGLTRSVVVDVFADLPDEAADCRDDPSSDDPDPALREEADPDRQPVF